MGYISEIIEQYRHLRRFRALHRRGDITLLLSGVMALTATFRFIQFFSGFSWQGGIVMR